MFSSSEPPKSLAGKINIMMLWYVGLTLVSHVGLAYSQSDGSYNGSDLDAPMLAGGPRGGQGAMLRFGCSQAVIERLDPLVNPAMNPSAHMHQIVGGNAFNASMPLEDISQLATCTTCHFTQDLSNYWTANLYFKARNGTYKRVPQMANQFNDGDEGGITIYYTSPGPNATTAFKPGFRMLTGDSTRRTSENLGKNMQQCYRCFSEPNFGGSMYSPCFDPKWDTDHLPKQPCSGGIRSNIIFPLCWDGKSLDSPDHREHVAHPIGGPPSFSIVSGTCPESHPVKIPQVMLEVNWDTRDFNDEREWPEDGAQPFVLSTGDNTGYGQHGDYVFGWQDDSLQLAMDNQCYLRNCSRLPSQMPPDKNKCSVPVTAPENIDGWMDVLPGGQMG
ncbi:CTR2 long splice variant [Apiospora arundinis]